MSKGLSKVIWLTVVLFLAVVVAIGAVNITKKSGDAGERGLDATEEGLLAELQDRSVIAGLCPGEGRSSPPDEPLKHVLKEGNAGVNAHEYNLEATFECSKEDYGKVDKCIMLELHRAQQYRGSENTKDIGIFGFVYGDKSQRNFEVDTPDAGGNVLATHEMKIKIPAGSNVINGMENLNLKSEYKVKKTGCFDPNPFNGFGCGNTNNLERYEFSISKLAICCESGAAWDEDSQYCLGEGEEPPAESHSIPVGGNCRIDSECAPQEVSEGSIGPPVPGRCVNGKCQ